MFHAFADTPKAVVTVAAFIGTYFVLLTIGRLLKRRAGVRLGFVFQLFCLAAAFYAALAVYAPVFAWRTHVGAILTLTSTALVVALINRYLWDYYYEKKRQTPIPHFLREMVGLLIFLIALLIVLSVFYHAEAQLRGLLAGSGIAAIVLGFAGQNLFGGIIAGISLQIGRPYKVGDWLLIDNYSAEVMEINWRSTRLRTNDLVYLDIPNNEIVRQTIVNYSYPSRLHAMRIRLGLEYRNPPNRVKDALYHAALNAEGVLHEPPPKIFVIDFADSAIIYEIKFFLENHGALNDVGDAIRTNIWYELKRQRMTIPFPVRTLQIERRAPAAAHEAKDQARAILRREALFECLPTEQLDGMLEQAAVKYFGRGERLIDQGDQGDSMFVLLRGTARVMVANDGTSLRVGSLRAGDCFGEMSLLTGEPRTATVQAERDCEVLEIEKSDMASLLQQSPECLEQLSSLLARRKVETEGIVRDAVTPAKEREEEYRESFLSRLRTFFEL